MPGTPSIERQTFTIDGFDYALVLPECGGLTLALTNGYLSGRGPLRGIYEEDDPFEKWEDYDPRIEVFDDITLGINAFRLIREARNRINGWANRVRPSYFFISPSTDRKAPVYDRICALLARRIKGYHYQRIGGSHQFYRLHGGHA